MEFVGNLNSIGNSGEQIDMDVSFDRDDRSEGKEGTPADIIRHILAVYLMMISVNKVMMFFFIMYVIGALIGGMMYLFGNTLYEKLCHKLKRDYLPFSVLAVKTIGLILPFCIYFIGLYLIT